MKKNTYLLQLAIISIFGITSLLQACTKVNGDGPVVTETRATGSYSGIHYALQGNLHIDSGSGNSVEIRAQQNIINVIETYINNHTLFIRLRNSTVIHSHEPIEVYLKTTDPALIHLSGSGNIIASKTISSPELNIESSGSGNIQLQQVQTGKLQARVSGSGKIEVLQGSATTEKIQLSGSGQALLSGMQADTAYTQTSGSGQIMLWVNQYLESEISGSGIVRYKGSPEVKKRISGSGEVRPW